MKSFFLTIFFIFLSVFLTVQATEQYYFFVQFADKNNSPYSISNPSEYLSQRAIERRADFNIQIDSTDLPVNPSYVSEITDLGLRINNRTKWLNGVTVVMTDTSLMDSVRKLPHVKKVQYTGKIDPIQAIRSKVGSLPDSIYYGSAYDQIAMLNGTFLHDNGYKGNGIMIGILDAGFRNADINQGFDSLRANGQILGTKDIDVSNFNVYKESFHGANVLSIMGGQMMNDSIHFEGVAPDASYWLIRTEYGPTENLVETDFWVSGIEFADSVGVDVINSSLGYTEFDDSTMNFTYADMNGKVSRASIAATIAAKKGIIVCNSAGNDGNDPWHYIGSPADADGIISVGALDVNGNPAYFSSYGPTSDGRVKPELCAMGFQTALINTSGDATVGSGTSYSSPLMAGMMACFLQYVKDNFSNVSLPTILNDVFKSGSLYNSPTSQMGYGIPDFKKASAFMLTDNLKKDTVDHLFFASYIPENKVIRLLLYNQIEEPCVARVYSIDGKLLISKELTSNVEDLSVSSLQSGLYIVNCRTNGGSESQKIIIQ